MFLFESLSGKIGVIIATALNMDKDQEEVISYGAFSLLQTIWAILWVIIVSSLFGILYEGLMITFAISIVRKYSGGVHSGSPGRCVILGTTVAVGFALLISKVLIKLNMNLVLLLAMLTVILSYYIVHKLAPVDSPAKPIVKEKSKQRLKKLSIRTLHILFGMSLIMLFLYTKNNAAFLLSGVQCIYIGILWQTFTLTNMGHAVLSRVDRTLEKVLK